MKHAISVVAPQVAGLNLGRAIPGPGLWEVLVREACLLVLGASLMGGGQASATAQEVPESSPQFSTQVDVVARTVYLDILDEKGRPVNEIAAELLKVIEDGVEMPVLELRPRVRAATGAARGGGSVSPLAGGAVGGGSAQPQRYVVVALDPVTLGRKAWDEAVDQLASCADALTAIGEVEVVALAAPPMRCAAASRDPAEVRAAIKCIGDRATPLDAFYTGRQRAARDLQQMFLDAEVMNPGIVTLAEITARELAASEEQMLRESLGRLQGTMVDTRRPLVVVWAAQADPDTYGFVRPFLPDWLTNEDRVRFTDRALGALTGTGAPWLPWARDGVTVVSWTRAADGPLLARSASTQKALPGTPHSALGSQPFTLFQLMADATGGAVVRTEHEIEAALGAAGGRLELVYQSDNAAAGWRGLRIEVARAGWSARVSPRQYVADRARGHALPTEGSISLKVELAAVTTRSEQGGRDHVQLPIVVDLSPLRGVLGPGVESRFLFRILATPPNGRAVAREVEVRAASLPQEGVLRYDTTLLVPQGTSAYVVEVRETTTGARGVAGPVAPTTMPGVTNQDPAPLADRVLATQAAGDTAGAFSDSTDVRISEARFLSRGETVPTAESIKVLWNKREQKLLRVVGGPTSPLELGVAIDVSNSVAEERAAFASAANAAGTRLMRSSDRAFRVDFGAMAHYVGAVTGGPGTLFAVVQPRPPEKTAVFDGLKFALEHFEGLRDRAALIVFSDGCETAGRTDWETVLKEARVRAIPVFVVMVDAGSCQQGESVQGDPFAYARSPKRDRSSAEIHTSRYTTSRWGLTELAKGSGGRVFRVKSAREAGGAWGEVEKALSRLWVAVFEPSEPGVNGRHVEVRSTMGTLLRPSA